MADSPRILIEHVSKAHADGRKVLDDVSLTVTGGEFVALVGPSGAGKTSLLRLINRLADASSGRVLVEGTDVTDADPIALRRRIGYVFQEVGLFPHLTVAENVGITPALIGWERERIAARVRELLALVRLDPQTYGPRLPQALSGGERQRVGVARALAAEPGIVLMDEPFGALDPLTRAALGEDYRKLHDSLGLTTVMITHDTLEAVLLADRIAVIRDGRIVAHDTPAALMAGASDDYVRTLMQAPRRQAERVQAILDGNGAR